MRRLLLGGYGSGLNEYRISYFLRR
jgi:hypothetical protein